MKKNKKKNRKYTEKEKEKKRRKMKGALIRFYSDDVICLMSVVFFKKNPIKITCNDAGV